MKQLFFVLVAAFLFSSNGFSQTTIQPASLEEFATISKAAKSGDRVAFDKEFAVLSKKFPNVREAYKKAIIDAGLKPACLQECDTQFTRCLYPAIPPFENYENCENQRFWCYLVCGATNPSSLEGTQK